MSRGYEPVRRSLISSEKMGDILSKLLKWRILTAHDSHEFQARGILLIRHKEIMGMRIVKGESRCSGKIGNQGPTNGRF